MGFHWSPCTAGVGAALPLSVAICCLILAPRLPILVALIVHGLIVCCFILAGGMVLTSLVMGGLMYLTRNRLGGKYYRLPEAQNGYEIRVAERRASRNIIGRNRNREVPMPVYYSVLPGPAAEREADGQRFLYTRRDSPYQVER